MTPNTSPKPDSDESYPYRISSDEQEQQAERKRYIDLAEIAFDAGDRNLAARYSDAARNIGLPRDAVEKLTKQHVDRIMEDVQWLMYGGAIAVEEHKRQEGRYTSPAGETKPEDSVRLFTENYPDLAEPVLGEVYHRLGLRDLRAQTEGAFDEETGKYSYTMLTSWGVTFVESRDTEDDYTIYTLSAQRTDF
jgi:hypothetical protein